MNRLPVYEMEYVSIYSVEENKAMHYRQEFLHSLSSKIFLPKSYICLKVGAHPYCSKALRLCSERRLIVRRMWQHAVEATIMMRGCYTTGFHPEGAINEGDTISI